MLGAERKFGDIFRAIGGNDENIVLTIATCAVSAFRQHEHGFNGNHHVRFENRVYILAEFKTGLASIIVAKGAKRVAIAEGPVLQQVVSLENFVQLDSNVTAPDARFDQFQAATMDFDIGLPDFELPGGAAFNEERSFTQAFQLTCCLATSTINRRIH